MLTHVLTGFEKKTKEHITQTAQCNWKPSFNRIKQNACCRFYFSFSCRSLHSVKIKTEFHIEYKWEKTLAKTVLNVIMVTHTHIIYIKILKMAFVDYVCIYACFVRCIFKVTVCFFAQLFSSIDTKYLLRAEATQKQLLLELDKINAKRCELRGFGIAGEIWGTLLCRLRLYYETLSLAQHYIFPSFSFPLFWGKGLWSGLRRRHAYSSVEET